MSIKTLRKRIALVAVSALGAGLMSVIAVPTANATAPTAATLYLAANANVPAATLVDTDDYDAADAASVGLLASAGSGVTQTATLLANGQLTVFTGTAGAGKNSSIVVTGGTVTKGIHTSTTAAYISTDRTYTVSAGVTGTEVANEELAAIVVPNSGVSSMTIQYYTGAGITESLPTNGTLTAQVVVTIATASVSGVYSELYSRVNTSLVAAAGTYTGAGAFSATVDGVDQTGASVIANGGFGAINITLKDAYNQLLSGKGALVVSATNGAGLAYSGTLGTGTTPTTLAVADGSDSEGTITVARPSAFANKSFSTTVTVAWNGATVSTKTFRFEGEVAKVVAESPTIQRVGTTTSAAPWAFRVKYYDDKDNLLYPQSGTSVVSATLNSVVTAASINLYGVAATATRAKGQVTCNTATAGSSAGAGSASLQLQHVNSSGSIVKSNVWTQLCAGDAATYSASLDKASYTPGSIATLTITCKDGRGNLANAVDPISETGSLLTVTGLGTAVTAPANLDACGDDADGVKQYQYVIGQDLGDFTAVISSPVINAQSETAAAVNQSITYKVAAASTGVTNAEVLAAIVKLIASINKQIRALQKSLRR